MDIQIRKQLEQLEYIKDKLKYIEYDKALGCYIEKQDGLPTGVAAWVNGAFYGFEQAAKAHKAKKLEGCVVVPVQCPDPDFADSLFDELSKKAIGEFGDDLLIHFSDIDEEKIWALMVEAAKAQAVPEGYVLVDAESLVLHARSIRIFNTGEQYSEDIEDHVCSIEAMLEAQDPIDD